MEGNPQETITPAINLTARLNRDQTFETPVPCEANRFARLVAFSMAEGASRELSPLCIYGGTGLGKTHLLNAIANHALALTPFREVPLSHQ